MIMLRGPLGAGGIERRDLVLRRFPERRTMCFVRSPAGLCVANLHATTVPKLAEEDLRKAATAAVDWAADSPLILGGDFNLRPNASDVFDELAKRFELRSADRPGRNRPPSRPRARDGRLADPLAPGGS